MRMSECELEQEITTLEARLKELRLELSILQRRYDYPIRELGLSRRTLYPLLRGGLENVRTIFEYRAKYGSLDDFCLAFRGFGDKCLQELKAKLQEKGFE